MANSRTPGSEDCSLLLALGLLPSRTPGLLGRCDAADPNTTAMLGDTQGSLGRNDLAAAFAARPTAFTPVSTLTVSLLQAFSGDTLPATTSAGTLIRKMANEFSLSAAAINLLMEVETLRLSPYDDQTAKNIINWVEGATIGYGHLIIKCDWDTYKNGISEPHAKSLLDSDLNPFLAIVQSSVTAKLAQNEFDAMVILAYNIGAQAFSESSVVKLVNNPKAKTQYKDLEAAWKAWNKSQGKVMKGLNNRRQCEWDIYTQAIYKRW